MESGRGSERRRQGRNGKWKEAETLGQKSNEQQEATGRQAHKHRNTETNKQTLVHTPTHVDNRALLWSQQQKPEIITSWLWQTVSVLRRTRYSVHSVYSVLFCTLSLPETRRDTVVALTTPSNTEEHTIPHWVSRQRWQLGPIRKLWKGWSKKSLGNPIIIRCKTWAEPQGIWGIVPSIGFKSKNKNYL